MSDDHDSPMQKIIDDTEALLKQIPTHDQWERAILHREEARSRNMFDYAVKSVGLEISDVEPGNLAEGGAYGADVGPEVELDGEGQYVGVGGVGVGPYGRKKKRKVRRISMGNDEPAYGDYEGQGLERDEARAWDGGALTESRVGTLPMEQMVLLMGVGAGKRTAQELADYMKRWSEGSGQRRVPREYNGASAVTKWLEDGGAKFHKAVEEKGGSWHLTDKGKKFVKHFEKVFKTGKFGKGPKSLAVIKAAIKGKTWDGEDDSTQNEWLDEDQNRSDSEEAFFFWDADQAIQVYEAAQAMGLVPGEVTLDDTVNPRYGVGEYAVRVAPYVRDTKTDIWLNLLEFVGEMIDDRDMDDFEESIQEARELLIEKTQPKAAKKGW